MAGPTTEVLNDDLKVLRDDLHKDPMEIKDEINAVRTGAFAEISRIKVSLAELKTQLNLSTKIAVWGITIIAGTLMTSTFGGIWWASKINFKVDLLELRYEKLESKIDKLEASIESRFDRLEAAFAKILEQTRPK